MTCETNSNCIRTIVILIAGLVIANYAQTTENPETEQVEAGNYTKDQDEFFGSKFDDDLTPENYNMAMDLLRSISQKMTPAASKKNDVEWAQKLQKFKGIKPNSAAAQEPSGGPPDPSRNLATLKKEYAETIHQTADGQRPFRTLYSKYDMIRRESFMYLLEFAPLERDSATEFEQFQSTVKNMQKMRLDILTKKTKGESTAQEFLEYRKNFEQYVQLSKQFAYSFGKHGVPFKTIFSYWATSYYPVPVQELYHKLIQEIRPVYEEVHTYVKMKLKTRGAKVNKDGSFQLTEQVKQVLNDIWDEKPKPKARRTNFEKELRKKKYTLETLNKDVKDYFSRVLQFDVLPEDFMIKTPDVFPEKDCKSETVDLYTRGAG